MNPIVMTLPFSQKSATLQHVDIGQWRIYYNRARVNGPLELGRRIWISWKTRPNGYYGRIRDDRRHKLGFVHRITARVREDAGVKYLQLIFFSWWVAVVRKVDGQFPLFLLDNTQE